MNTEWSSPPYEAEEQPAAKNEWMERLIGFAAQCENEGILGLAQATMEQTTSITVQLASAVTSTACHIVSEAGRAMMQQQQQQQQHPTHVEEVGREATTADKETPFLFKIAFQITDIVLAAISPALSTSNYSTRTYSAYSHGTDSRLMIEDDNVDMFSTTSCYNEDFHDAHSCACDESSSVYSVYFDANATVSTCSESDDTTDLEEGTEDSQSCIIESIPNMLYTTATTSTSSSPTYFLDMTDVLLSRMDDNIDIPLMKKGTGGDCFAFNSDSNNEASVQAVLDAIIQHSLELLTEENTSSMKWQPHDTTKKLLHQYGTTSYENVHWMQILEREVLKWTTQVESTPMLKTLGIVNMTPIQLNDLLLDCTKVQEYNKFSLGKKDLCAFFYPLCGGQVKVVEHIMQVPIVGGKVETLSLTHSRPLLDDSSGFVIVSRSIKKELNDDVPNPCFSISSLRSIEGNEKTELTTLTSTTSLPIPKFLMNRVAFYGADDFFCNLRKIT